MNILKKTNMKIIKILLLLVLIATIGCTKKTVQIPVFGVPGIQDTIYDNSQIWMFLEVKDGDTIATLNRKNSISTTSWIFNIDKKLPMHLVIPHLEKLIEKREKPSLHQKDEDDFNYFSYVDSDSGLLSLVQFDVIYFDKNKVLNHIDFAKDTIKKHLVLDYNTNQLTINDSLVPFNNLNTYIQKLSSTMKMKVHLNFDANIKYQNYLELKAQLQNNMEIELDTIEYVY